MDNQEFIGIFIKQYRELLASKSSHDQIKKFNKNLSRFSTLLVYPYPSDEPEKVALLVGFADTYEIHQFNDSATMPKAMSQVKSPIEWLTVDKDLVMPETVAIKTTDIEPLPLRKVEWSELINAPKIDDYSFGAIQSAFLEYFNLDDYAYQEGVDEMFDFNHYFSQEKNKPADLELREVWCDVDSGDKYGNIQILIFWKNEFIGWITCSGRYLGDYSASTVSLDKWSELMEAIYESSGYKPGRNFKGVSIYDMNNDDVDDIAYVPGISTRQYSD